VSEPWDETLEDEIRQSAPHIFEVKVYGPTGSVNFGPRIPLDVISCEITYDVTWSPYVQGTLTAVMPDPATMAKLDPRKVITVQVSAGYVRPGGRRDLRPMCTHAFVSHRTANYPANTVTLQFQGMEYLVDRVSAFSPSDSPQAQDEGQPYWTPATTVYQAIESVLLYTEISSRVPSNPTAYELGTDTFTGWVPAGETWAGQAGDNSLDVAREIADRNSLLFYADELGVWHVDYQLHLDDPVHSLRDGADGTIVQADDELSREGWANVVQVTYVWNTVSATTAGRTDLVTHQATAQAYLGDGPLSVETVGACPIQINRQMPSSNSLARTVAVDLLRRYSARGTAMQVEAVAAYWLRARDFVTVQLPNRQTPATSVEQIIQAITYDLGAGLMRMRLVQPEPGNIQAL
jgi:hypothetical protein